MRAVHQRQQRAAVHLAPAGGNLWEQLTVKVPAEQRAGGHGCSGRAGPAERKGKSARGWTGGQEQQWSAGGRRVAASAAGADRHPVSCDPPSAGMITCACDPESRSGAKLEVGCGCTGGQATRRARSCNVCNVQARRAACHALNPPLSMQGASVGVAPLTARHSCRSALQAQRNPCQLPERL